MRDRPRAFAAIGLSAAAGLLAGATPPGAEVRVAVSGLRSPQGLVHACLTASPAAFPDCRRDPSARALTVKASDLSRLDFGRVAPGRYAIALLHDENGNGKADRALRLIPTEGFGFSRDAPVRMGPPRFAEAAFDVRDEPVIATIRMRYLF